MSAQRGDGRVVRLVRNVRNTEAPVYRTVRTAKIAALPVAFAGRQAGGVYQRARGKSRDEVNRDIQAQTAQHIFEVLGNLRGCAVKLGQILALYELVLPSEIGAPYGEALARLQDSGPAMLPKAVHAAMRDSMGRSWRAHFLEFDDEHPKAASIGQVHRAVWHDGRPVAVKIQYPGAQQAVEADLVQLRRISTVAGAMLPGAEVKPIVDSICGSIMEELDYANEARNQRIFAEAYAGDPEFLVPQVIAHEGDVLVSEWVGGTSLSKIIAWGGPQVERDRIAAQIVRFNLHGPQRCGLMYGDPHPGNYRVLPDGRLGVIDFGACAELPADFEEFVLDAAEAMLNGGPTELEAMIRRRGFVQPGRDFDVPALQRALEPYREALCQPAFCMTEDWVRGRVAESVDLRLSNVYRQLTMSPDLTAVARMLLSATGVLLALKAQLATAAPLIEWMPELEDVLSRAAARPRSVGPLRIVR